MVRMEIMMEALIRDRGLAMTPSREPDHDEHAGNRASSASDVPLPLLDRIHPALIDLGQQASATPLPSQIGEATPPTNSTYHIRVGERLVRFPKPEAYTEYMATFFGDIHLRYPCLDHDEFTTRTKCLLESGDIPYADKHLVALNLIIFACCDIMYGLSTTDERLQHGRHWFDEAQTLINHAEFLGGSADLVLAQYLLFQVS